MVKEGMLVMEKLREAGGGDVAILEEAKCILEKMNEIQKERRLGSKSERGVWQSLHELFIAQPRD